MVSLQVLFLGHLHRYNSKNTVMQVEHTSTFLFRYIKVVCLPMCTQAAFLPCYTKGMLQKDEGNALKKKKRESTACSASSER